MVLNEHIHTPKQMNQIIPAYYDRWHDLFEKILEIRRQKMRPIRESLDPHERELLEHQGQYDFTFQRMTNMLGMMATLAR